MSSKPEWWRGQSPPRVAQDPASTGRSVSGSVTTIDLDAITPGGSGLRRLYLVRATVSDVQLWLNDVSLLVQWSAFENCHFRQRVRPVLNQYGFAAQGSFANRPAVYRGCTFERVRFKTLGGFNTGAGRFENCTFVNCRWEGHFAYDADLIDCRFVGRMNGCVWGGTDRDSQRRNVITGNDFTEVKFTDNVGWRHDFPIADQVWPENFVPRVADDIEG
ncbi:hypothetical protein ACIBL3_46880 [Kribbella sp. NPDC050124]|uniref:hypothetical protein n=1 Tax=Kribbella sp. NPDC050124 TaxID=3364114 RepID=UPI0037B01FD3